MRQSNINLTSRIIEVDLHGLRVGEAIKRSKRSDRGLILG